jgi:hypothetical protein
MSAAGKLPISRREHMRIALRVHTALWELRVGRGTREEWADLSDCINVIEALSDAGKLDCRRVMPFVTSAIAGMVEAARELREGRPMAMAPDAVEAIRKLLCEYDPALGKFSEQTMKAATQAVILRVAEQRIKPDNGVMVVEA